ncbi:MAG TPA: hypothetical protein P5551_00805 [Syntrophales bacterium]|jgi:hypothetical protein|nr:hypothetical protein [Syntrophales bacterium]HRT60884.1 hypothetical protein [Syntrophales bacterium]
MTSREESRMRVAGTLLVLAAFILCLAAGAPGQTLYEYKDKSGAVVITDKPPDKTIRGVRKYEYTPETSPAPAPRSTATEEKTLNVPQRGPQGPPPAPPEEMENQRKEELKRYEAEEYRKRDAAARKLEEEAMKPAPYSRETVQRQNELLERAQKIRSGQDPLPAPKK